jgi:hypothetical protein
VMSYDEWRPRIIGAARDIASRDFQKEARFPGGKVLSSPDEVYQALIEDLTFDLFLQTRLCTRTSGIRRLFVHAVEFLCSVPLHLAILCCFVFFFVGKPVPRIFKSRQVQPLCMDRNPSKTKFGSIGLCPRQQMNPPIFDEASDVNNLFFIPDFLFIYTRSVFGVENNGRSFKSDRLAYLFRQVERHVCWNPRHLIAFVDISHDFCFFDKCWSWAPTFDFHWNKTKQFCIDCWQFDFSTNFRTFFFDCYIQLPSHRIGLALNFNNAILSRFSRNTTSFRSRSSFSSLIPDSSKS